jgi:hypothetical protein
LHRHPWRAQRISTKLVKAKNSNVPVTSVLEKRLSVTLHGDHKAAFLTAPITAPNSDRSIPKLNTINAIGRGVG